MNSCGSPERLPDVGELVRQPSTSSARTRHGRADGARHVELEVRGRVLQQGVPVAPVQASMEERTISTFSSDIAYSSSPAASGLPPYRHRSTSTRPACRRGRSTDSRHAPRLRLRSPFPEHSCGRRRPLCRLRRSVPAAPTRASRPTLRASRSSKKQAPRRDPARRPAPRVGARSQPPTPGRQVAERVPVPSRERSAGPTHQLHVLLRHRPRSIPRRQHGVFGGRTGTVTRQRPLKKPARPVHVRVLERRLYGAVRRCEGSVDGCVAR